MQGDECGVQATTSTSGILCASVHPPPCRHYGVESFVKHNPDANTEVLDIEDLNKLGEHRQICPYYLARWMGRRWWVGRALLAAGRAVGRVCCLCWDGACSLKPIGLPGSHGQPGWPHCARAFTCPMTHPVLQRGAEQCSRPSAPPLTAQGAGCHR